MVYENNKNFEVIHNGIVVKRGSGKLLRTFKVKSDGSTLLWELTQGREALFDAKDFECLLIHNWRFQRDKHVTNPDFGYAHTTDEYNRVFSANRYLAGLPTGCVTVDHKNRNGLDNRRCNLRLATREQQSINQTRQGFKGGVFEFSCPYRGVVQRSDNFRYRVRGSVLGVQYNLGHFSDPIKAAEAWDDFLYESFKNHDPLKGLEMNGIKSEPTINFIRFNFPERLGIIK